MGTFGATDGNAAKSFIFGSRSNTAMTGPEGLGRFTPSGNIPEEIAFEEEKDLESSNPKDPTTFIYMDELLDTAQRWRSPYP